MGARSRVPAVLVAVVLVLVGCSPYGDPVRWEAGELVTGVPAVDWPRGAPDLGTEWVAALVRADAALAAANNVHDFSDPVLRELVEEEYLWRVAMWSRNNAGILVTPGSSSYYYFPGPRPMLVLDVDVSGDDGYVTVCELSGWWTMGEPTTVEDIDTWVPDYGGAFRYTLQRDALGAIRVAGVDAARGPCEIDGVRPGYFDPAPPYGQEVLAEDFVSPDGGVMPNSQGFWPDGTRTEPDVWWSR